MDRRYSYSHAPPAQLTYVMAEAVHQTLKTAVNNLMEDIKKLVNEKYTILTKNELKNTDCSINENVTLGEFKVEIKVNPEKAIKKKSRRNKIRDKKRMTNFKNKKIMHDNKCDGAKIGDMDLIEFTKQMLTMMNSMKASVQISNTEVVQSFTTPKKNTFGNADVFPVRDMETTSDDIINDSNITVTEKSLCEGVKDEYFDDLLNFTHDTLRQNSVCEDYVVLREVRAFPQGGPPRGDSSSDGGHWQLRSGHYGAGGEGSYDLHSGLDKYEPGNTS